VASIHTRTWTTKQGKTKTAFRVGFVDAAGAQKFRQFPTKAQANRFMTTIAMTVTANKVGGQVLFGAVCEEWLSACERGRAGAFPLDRSTVASYAAGVRNHIAPFLGKSPCQEITKKKLQDYRDWLITRVPRRATAASNLRIAKIAIGYALETGALTIDPRPGVRVIVKDARVDKTEDTHIHSIETMRRILSKADELSTSPVKKTAKAWLRYRLILRVLVYGGLRASELRGLRIGDVTDSHLRIRQRADRYGDVGKLKTQGGYRDIPLPQALTKDLQVWIGKRTAGLLFPTLGDKPISHTNLRKRMWVEVQNQIGLSTDRHLGLHSLRHFFASRHIAAKTDLKTLSHLLGHASVTFTLDVYGHLFEDDRRRGQGAELAEELVL
jgi:integrase